MTVATIIVTAIIVLLSVCLGYAFGLAQARNSNLED